VVEGVKEMVIGAFYYWRLLSLGCSCA
jgi:hypothetical protein